MTDLSALQTDLSGRLKKAGDSVTLNHSYFESLHFTVSADFDGIIQRSLFPATSGGQLIASRGDNEPAFTLAQPTSLTVSNLQLPALFGLTSIDCTLQFELSGTQLDLVVTIELPNEVVGFNSKAFILSTSSTKMNYPFSGPSHSIDLTEGLNFAAVGAIDAGGPLSTVLGWLLSGNSDQAIVLFGQVDPAGDDTSYPDLEVVAKLSGTPITVAFIKLSNPRLGIQLFLDESPTVFFAMDLTLGSETNQITAIISDDGLPLVRFGIVPTIGNHPLTIGTLLGQNCNGNSLKKQWDNFPTGGVLKPIVNLIGNVALDHFSTTLSFTGHPKILDFQVVVGTASPISVNDDSRFQIQNATVTWNCLDPMGTSPINDFAFQGEFKLFDHRFAVEITDAYISGRSYDSISLGDLLESPPFAISFDDVAIQWNYGGEGKQLSLSATLNASFDIFGTDAPPFLIDDFTFTFQTSLSNSLQQKASTATQFSGVILIGNYGLSLTGAYTAGQWEFTATLDRDIPLSELITNLFADLGIDLSNIPDLSLSGLTLSIQTGDASSFSITGQCELGSETGAFELACQKSKTTKSWEFVAALEVKLQSPADLGSFVPVFGDDLKGIVEFNNAIFVITSHEPSDIKLGNTEFQNIHPIPGATFLADLTVAGSNVPVVIPLVRYSQKPTNQVAVDARPTTKSNDTSPGDASSPTSSTAIQKRIGPIYIRSLQFAFSKDIVTFIIDGGLLLGNLNIDFVDLSIGIPLTSPSDLRKYTGDLDGLSVTYGGAGPVTISGGFTRLTDLFLGEVQIKTATLSLTAVGEYGTFVDGAGRSHKTVFIFAVLDYPLGGPAFAFVTGLAAGFGYNSNLRIPTTLDDLPNFPLIAGSKPKQTTFAPGGNQQEALQNAQKAFTSWITPQADQMWLAAGVLFRSFQMIETLALLTVEFGKEFQIALFGRSQMTIPPNAPEKLAYAELDVMATFDPQAGALKVLGVLSPNSWVIAPECHLTGGFAFCLWESGKFVVTYGGYHPRFNYAAQGFPAVPRLQLYWQLDSHTQVKGSEYFALTGGAMMAGGGLEATWESGIFSASFTLTADFLMEWRPFHFEADLSMSIAVEFTLTIVCISTHFSFHLGVAVHLEGPPLHGTAEIDLSVVSFTVTFGSSKQETQPLAWKDFLPLLPGYDKAAEDCFAAPKAKVLAGRVDNHGAASDDSQLGAINPKELLIEIETVVPVNVLKVNGATVGHACTKIQGIGPMKAIIKESDSTLELKLDKLEGRDFNVCTDEKLKFVPAPTPREAPAALWSLPSDNSDINTPSIENVLTVVRVQPATPSIDSTKAVDVKVLLIDDVPENDRMFPFAGAAGATPTLTTDKTRADLAAQLVAAAEARQKIAAALTDAGWVLGNDDVGASAAAQTMTAALWEPPPWMPLC